MRHGPWEKSQPIPTAKSHADWSSGGSKEGAGVGIMAAFELVFQRKTGPSSLPNFLRYAAAPYFFRQSLAAANSRRHFSGCFEADRRVCGIRIRRVLSRAIGLGKSRSQQRLCVAMARRALRPCSLVGQTAARSRPLRSCRQRGAARGRRQGLAAYCSGRLDPHRQGNCLRSWPAGSFDAGIVAGLAGTGRIQRLGSIPDFDGSLS